MSDGEVRFAQLLICKVMTYEHVGDVCLKVENSLNIDSGNVISRQHSWLPNNDRCSIKCSQFVTVMIRGNVNTALYLMERFGGCGGGWGY